MRNEFSKPRIVLDTKPLIKLFAKEEGWETVQKILSSVEDGKIEAAMSVVTLTEIYYKYLQEKRADLARTRVEALRYAVYVKKLEINEEGAVKAGAYFEDATVISDDADLKKIAEIRTLTEKEFLSRLG